MKKKMPKIVIVIVIALFISIVNYLCYPLLIDKKFEKIKVPIVKTKIEEMQLVDEDCITYVEIYRNSIGDSIIVNGNEILGNYVKAGYTLDVGMYFYKNALISENELMGTIGSNLQENKNLYPLKLEANDMVVHFNAGQFVDLYFTGYDSYYSGKPVFGMLLEHILIKEVTYDNLDKVSYIFLSLTQEELDYLSRSLTIGKISPIISSNSTLKEISINDYYMVDRLKAFIDEYTVSFNGGSNVRTK